MILAEAKRVLFEGGLVVFVLVPGNEAGVGVLDKHLPILAGNLELSLLLSWPICASRAPVGKCARVARIVQNLCGTT